MPNSAARCDKSLIILGLRLRSTTSCRWADANAAMLRLSKTTKQLKTWSGRRGSNPRRPAWEQVRLFNLKDLCVSDALLRFKQASPNQQHPQQALLIKVQTRYLVCPYRYPFAKHSWARNSNGSRSSASRKPRGVLREFLRSQFTSER